MLGKWEKLTSPPGSYADTKEVAKKVDSTCLVPRAEETVVATECRRSAALHFSYLDRGLTPTANTSVAAPRLVKPIATRLGPP